MNLIERTAATAAVMLVKLPISEVELDFNLEKTVCSHGLFMMAPNHWDPQSKTLQRPLRLTDEDDDETSYMVQISHPTNSLHALLVRVYGTASLSPKQHHSLLEQVRRMLRLSVEESERVREFHQVHEEAKRRGFGRVFRSPTLFEDMIKCMLLCNCQWSRTLSMAQALCELQFELRHPLLPSENGTISTCQSTETKQFIPETPTKIESKKRSNIRKYSEIVEVGEETDVKIQRTETSDFFKNRVQESDSTSLHNSKPLEGIEIYPFGRIGNFPSPRELASLDEKFLEKRCKLGYRAGRVIQLAREVVESRIQLRQLEDEYVSLSLSDYDKLTEILRAINGFGPFTCSNVLMCMGFYHVIPTDSETIRHLKQVHGKSSTIKTIQKDVDVIYGKYAPFQFLAYWSEVWNFYEERFGNLSEMPHSDYKLITASNMRPKTPKKKLKRMCTTTS